VKNGLIALPLLAILLLLAAASPAAAAKKKEATKEDPYADYVWPPPPDKARIKLDAVISGRLDIEAESKFKKLLIGASPQSRYDRLVKPFGVAFDPQGRILVTDAATASLLRFDRKGERMDVFGTKGTVPLQLPLGLSVAPDGTIYVADATQAKVIAFDDEGDVVSVYGRQGELKNPTDAVLAPDGKRLFVADSKAHQIVIFDKESGEILDRFGERGEGDGQFSFPTSLTFGPDGLLYVVDQLNSRIQVFDGDGQFVDTFGNLGVGFAQFVRPKDVAVDEVGFIYVTDNAFNNVQIFDTDFTLLTFVGRGGDDPGQFHGASGVAVRGSEIAVVDQLGHRLQVFHFLGPKTGE